MGERLDAFGRAASCFCGWALVVTALLAALTVAGMLGALLWAGR